MWTLGDGDEHWLVVAPAVADADLVAAATHDIDEGDCDTCRYTGSAFCAGVSVYLLVQRQQQRQHRGFLLGLAGTAAALGVARFFL